MNKCNVNVNNKNTGLWLTHMQMFLESVKVVYGSICISTTPALPGVCFRCSARAASMSESVVLGLHLLTASEGREYEY